MPAQTTASRVVYYSENDTAPDLVALLEDGDGNAIDLTGASVAITIAYAKADYFYQPTAKIVDAYACVPDPDQVTNTGIVRYTPAAGHLTPPGAFLYVFEVTYSGGGVQTLPANTYLPLIIRTPVSGSIEGPP